MVGIGLVLWSCTRRKLADFPDTDMDKDTGSGKDMDTDINTEMGTDRHEEYLLAPISWCYSYPAPNKWCYTVSSM